jgi:hypothetical protein
LKSQSADPPGSKNWKITAAQVNHYLQRLGYGFVQRRLPGNRVSSAKEYVILSPKYIDTMKQFEVHKSPANGSYPIRDFDATAWIASKEYRKKLKPYQDFAKTHPELRGFDFNEMSPRNISALKLLIYALKNKKVLDRRQEEALVAYRTADTPSDPEYTHELFDIYKKEVLDPQGLKPKLTPTELANVARVVN